MSDFHRLRKLFDRVSDLPAEERDAETTCRPTATSDGVLREVLVTPNSSVVFTGDQKDPQDDIAIVVSDAATRRCWTHRSFW